MTRCSIEPKKANILKDMNVCHSQKIYRTNTGNNYCTLLLKQD